jgi:hypothetical protein
MNKNKLNKKAEGREGNRRRGMKAVKALGLYLGEEESMINNLDEFLSDLKLGRVDGGILMDAVTDMMTDLMHIYPEITMSINLRGEMETLLETAKNHYDYEKSTKGIRYD